MNFASQLRVRSGGPESRTGDHPARQVALRAAVILLVTGGCLATVAIGHRSPVRVVLSLSFLLFVPGLALTEAMEIRDLAQRVAIATTASLGVDTLVAVALVYTHAFSITLAIGILAAVTVVAVAWALVRSWRVHTDAVARSRPGA